MFPIKTKITRTGLGFTAKEWRVLLKEAWARVGVYWHQHILPKHFTVAGAQEYGYAPRSPKYLRRKSRVQGHQRPLVWSGNTERQARRWRDVRATSKGARVVLRLPKYAYQVAFAGLVHPDFRKAVGTAARTRLAGLTADPPTELMAVSERDAQACAEVLDRFIQREAKKSGPKRDITRGHRRAG